MEATEQDLDLQILRQAGPAALYRVNVIQSPAGEADGEFELPYSESELNELFRGLGQVRRATRGAASPEVARAREFGTQLFDRVFSGDVRDCLSNSRGRCQAAGQVLRIRLRLTKVPELLDMPWELMFDRRYNRFIALDDATTVVRHLPIADPVLPMRVDVPLRVLVAISNPRGDLDAEQEWTKLTSALVGVVERGLVEVDRLQPATFDGLEARLRAGGCHVLHFVGHGGYDATTQSGFLSFEVDPGGEKQVGAMRLADLLRPHRSLRLVVLNACEGGRTSRDDAFAGVAQSLVQSAIPAVVAMQFPVTDDAAIEFAGAFYAGLAAGRPVDLALADARREVNLKGEEGDIEWATPVLYMRGSGALFDVGVGARSEPVAQPAALQSRPAASAVHQAAPSIGAAEVVPKQATAMPTSPESAAHTVESPSVQSEVDAGDELAEPLGARGWVNAGLSALALAALLVALYFYAQPRFDSRWLWGGGLSLATVGGFVLAWLKWLAGDEAHAMARRSLRHAHATIAIAITALALTVLAGYLMATRPVVLRVVPGTKLAGHLKPANTPYSLRIWQGKKSGEPTWTIEELTQSGAVLGCSERVGRLALSRSGSAIEAAMREYLKPIPLSEEVREDWLHRWQRPEPVPIENSAMPRRNAQPLYFELRKGDVVVELKSFGVQSLEEAEDAVDLVFVEPNAIP